MPQEPALFPLTVLLTAFINNMQKTLVVHHRSGIGDLVWHIPYIRAIAATSSNGKVTVLARPSCKASDLLAGESSVEDVIEYDRKPRDKNRKGKHDSIRGQLQLCMELRKRKFGRIIIFSSRARYGILALIAGIPVRYGFGFGLAQRLFLNHPPYISRFKGEGSWVYPEATDFAIAHKFVDHAVTPRMSVPEELLEEISTQLAYLNRPRIALAIGASNLEKNWGAENFVKLTGQLVKVGYGVLVLGGPAEKAWAEALFHASFEPDSNQVHVLCQASVLRSAAALKTCDFCIGNDTGMLNVAAAVNVPALGLFGKTRPLMHDPILHAISGNDMVEISVEAVINRLAELNVLTKNLV